MPINDLCFKNIVTLKKEASLMDAAKLMRNEHVGAIVITDKGKKAVGILTDRDIVIGAVANQAPLGAKVSEFMSKNVLCVPQKSGVAEVIEQMEKREVRRAVVVDGGNHPCGLISSDDLVQLLGTELNSLGTLVNRQLANEVISRAMQ